MLIAIIISAICSLCEACLSSTPMSFVSTLKGKSGADIIKYIDSMKGSRVWVMRIDDKVINTEMSKAITTKEKLKESIFGK